MSSNRDWMYTKRLTSNGSFNPEFQYYVTYFLDFAFTNATNIRSKTINGDVVSEIRCPCSKCENFYYKTRVLVEGDLYINGFMANYYIWDAHGELYGTQDMSQCSNPPVSSQYVGQCSNPVPSQHAGQCSNPVTAHDIVYDDMVIESMYQSHASYYEQEPQDPNQTAETFFTMLRQANEPLWDGCKKASVLSTITRLLNWKAECNVSDSTFDRLLPIIKDCLPDGEKLPRNFYDTKKILKPLELPSQRIHVCKNQCMLFNKQSSDLDHCRVCKESRYKPNGKKVPNMFMTYNPIGPRLQRLFYAKMIARHLTWHADHPIQEEKMTHPSEGSAWKHFDTVFPDFAQETRNVRIGLCTDGFSPNNSNSSPHSCWPVFVTVYNLPPWLAFKQQYIQIPLLIPGKKSPGQNLDVFLQPLVDELKMLFSDGIETYDAYRKNNFQMRVVLLWTVSDFPAYGMLSGWSTHGKLACPYCSDKSGSFRLHFGSKPCWFDCHRKHLPNNHSFRKDKVNFLKNKTVRGSKIPIPAPTGDEIWQAVQHITTVYQGTPHGTKYYDKPYGFGESHNWVKRSIFWELPYWCHLLIRHNLDVMHIEKNVFDNLFHIIMGTPKSKDNVNARKDIELLCDRSYLNPIHQNNGKIGKNRGDYTLPKDDVKKVCAWLKELKFPDGYASNIGNCVNIVDNSFYSFKSHDCHVFMQRLLPLAIRGFVPTEIYEAVTELSTFFRVLCSKTLYLEDLSNMKRTIAQTVCKLERIFPPAFFDSMEHLVIHLVDEAIAGGPVHYRWMYQYERKLGLIKRRIRNKARVEGSIVNEHLVNELATHCSLYFSPTIETRHNREPRNFAPQHPSSSSEDSALSIFVFPSRRLYEKGGKRRIMTPDELHKAHTYVLLNCPEVLDYIIKFDEVAPQLYPNDPVSSLRDKYFAEWFKDKVKYESSNGSAKHLQIIARKPSQHALSYNGYFVNGYKFHTREYGKGRLTSNYGVCVRGEMYNDEESDYYGLLDEILELEYMGSGRSIVVLFNCTWFDNNHGVVVNKNKLVDVKPKSRLQTNDPFILASQAEQVFYTPYPAVKNETKDLWAVVKTKPRGIYEVTEAEMEAAKDWNREADGFFQIDERFELPIEVTNSERMCLVTNPNTVEQIVDEEDEEFEEAEGSDEEIQEEELEEEFDEDESEEELEEEEFDEDETEFDEDETEEEDFEDEFDEGENESSN